MTYQLLLTLALVPFAFLAARDLRKASKTGVIGDGGDWDFDINRDRVGFGFHFLLLMAPIFGFVVASALTLMEFFN